MKGKASVALLIVLTLLLVSGCTRIRDSMAAFVGRHQSELLAEWGPPNNVTGDGKGGSILDYSETKLVGGNTITMPRGQNIQVPYSTRKVVMAFYVDQEGVIYNYLYK